MLLQARFHQNGTFRPVRATDCLGFLLQFGSDKWPVPRDVHQRPPLSKLGLILIRHFVWIKYYDITSMSSIPYICVKQLERMSVLYPIYVRPEQFANFRGIFHAEGTFGKYLSHWNKTLIEIFCKAMLNLQVFVLSIIDTIDNFMSTSLALIG